jgi:hypothetical protein
MLSRQAFSTLAMLPAYFHFNYFSERGPALHVSPSTHASHVAGIKDVHHTHLFG